MVVLMTVCRILSSEVRRWFCLRGVFVFQAEGGIRGCALVTGVQTCALPIFRSGPREARRANAVPYWTRPDPGIRAQARSRPDPPARIARGELACCAEIGRASCRERVCQYV